MTLQPIDKRRINSENEIDVNYISIVIDRIAPSSFGFLDLKGWLKSKITPYQKEDAINQLVAWTKEELSNATTLSLESDIPVEISIGSWIGLDGAQFAGTEVKLGSNGGTYYYYEIRKLRNGVFSIAPA